MSISNRGDTWPEAILFDLDGTLIDSAPDIAAAVNEVLSVDRLPSLSVETVRSMIGNGVPKLVERAFAASSRALSAVELQIRVEVMMKVYGRHLTGLTTLLPGAREVISQFAAMDIKTAVVSNKPHSFTMQILDHYGMSAHLTDVQGADPLLKPKPAPDMLNAVLRRLGVSNDAALFVGDSKVDSDAARAAAIQVVIIDSGYGHAVQGSALADAFCNSLFDLPRVIKALKMPSGGA